MLKIDGPKLYPINAIKVASYIIGVLRTRKDARLYARSCKSNAVFVQIQQTKNFAQVNFIFKYPAYREGLEQAIIIIGHAAKDG